MTPNIIAVEFHRLHVINLVCRSHDKVVLTFRMERFTSMNCTIKGPVSKRIALNKNTVFQMGKGFLTINRFSKTTHKMQISY